MSEAMANAPSTVATQRVDLAPLLAPTWEARAQSSWRRWFNAIMAGRQRKADQFVAEYLRHQRGKHHDELRRVLERRLSDRQVEAGNE
jgi:hypothetical protein